MKEASVSNSTEITQEELNKMHKGPEFDMAINYAYTLNTVFVTLFYCSGLPIILFFAFF